MDRDEASRGEDAGRSSKETEAGAQCDEPLSKRCIKGKKRGERSVCFEHDKEEDLTASRLALNSSTEKQSLRLSLLEDIRLGLRKVMMHQAAT